MGKLMKYELRSMLRLFAPLWAAILALSILNHFTVRVEALSTLLHGIPAIVLMILYVVGILAMIVVALAFLIQRFYVGLLKDEGYLMFTLPVKTSALLWAKCLSATILILATTLVSVASALVMALDGDTLRSVHEGIQELSRRVDNFGGLMTLTLILGLVLLVVSTVKSILQAYLAMCIGQLASKHKAGFSVLAYVGITIVLSAVFTTAMTLAENNAWFAEMAKVLNFSEMPTAGMIWFAFGVLFVIAAIQIAIFYFPAQAILQHKLNLE
ncbi:MAG: hypothetical protein VB055_10635 [Oscillospiraceae bacterium]|nr:hypothetical protein [Oscillospiraceae bacterium]